jgi:hypothetical protein
MDRKSETKEVNDERRFDRFNGELFGEPNAPKVSRKLDERTYKVIHGETICIS